MTTDRLGTLRRNAVTLELDEIQATVLRYRPEPYCGSHILLHIDDKRGGREVPPQARTAHIDSAAE